LHSVNSRYSRIMDNYAQNKKALFDYEILETFEAGIQLEGFEVKAVRQGYAALSGTFITMRGEEAYLTNCSIAPYQPGNTPSSYDPARPRKLLLHKKELKRLMGIVQQKGLTIVPLKLYNKNAMVKIEIGIARGKRVYEKREKMKKRTAEREIEREMKSQSG